eukprot:5203152-Amphidinium_carterae.1
MLMSCRSSPSRCPPDSPPGPEGCVTPCSTQSSWGKRWFRILLELKCHLGRRLCFAQDSLQQSRNDSPQAHNLKVARKLPAVVTPVGGGSA